MPTGAALLAPRSPLVADRAGLATIYGPELARVVFDEAREIEAQLDEVWPGWRQRRPFAHLPRSALLRVKRLLGRRELLLTGRESWGLRVVEKPGKRTVDGLSWPLVVPIPPPRRGGRPRDQFGPHATISAPRLAYALAVPLERVEAALLEAPADTRDVPGWCAARLRQEGSHASEGGRARGT